ncbi:MAG: anhydro-N-acetylmuramic acid kinase [Pseudomonadota bacterium]
MNTSSKLPDLSDLSDLYIGLMSGTSLDGVDGVLVALPGDGNAHGGMQMLASAYVPFPAELREQLMALQQPGANEIHMEALAANALVERYAACVATLREKMPAARISAIGVHGQTIRHRPELGYTRQTNNPALLAELTGIDVVADLRSRDVAAGGQGAPLVPAFHRAVFGAPDVCRVVANMGGIGNISILRADGTTTGFDTGPGNVLMDAWIAQQQGKPYDDNGSWARLGAVNDALLRELCDEAYLRQAPPKSTGRDLFRPDWMNGKLKPFAGLAAVDVQATLCAFTAVTIADEIARHAADADSVYVCGGGAYNACLLDMLGRQLAQRGCHALVATTDELGVSPNHVEALAFAWLAQRFTHRLAGNLPEVTGAKGLRILGALYPA